SHGIIHACLNGDIDNYQNLRQDLGLPPVVPADEEVTTDTKIIPLQIEKYLKEGHSLDESFRLAMNDFEGSHAITMHSDLEPGKLYLAQKGSGQAVFVGLADDHYVPASEIYGIVEQTSKYIKLDGEKVVEGRSGKTQGQILILDSSSSGGLAGIKTMYYDGLPIELTEDDIKETEITSRDIDRQQYPHYFLKEISESPLSVEQTIRGRLAIIKEGNIQRPQITLDESVIPPDLESAIKEKKIKKIFFIGQGTAGIAAAGCAEVLKYYLDSTDIHVTAVKASELSGFMLGETREDTLVVAISQSGTTTDTNRAVDMIKERGAFTMAIVNRRDSDLTFKVDGVLYTSRGRDIEMSVASTKAYYCQIVAGSILGLRLAELSGTADENFIISEIQHLWQLPVQMREVLADKEHIGQSAQKFAVTKKDWAIVGSGPNKIAADEIRIKLSELCYKTISSDVVEDKKHIDLSSEPLIFVCAAGNSENVVGDIVKDTAIFKAHQAVPIVVTTRGEHRFDNYADAVIHVPETTSRFAPLINTLVGHLWGYYAALAINEESRYLNDFRVEINQQIEDSVENGLDVYEILLNETFREKVVSVYGSFKERIRRNRYATAMAIHAASDLTLLLKYLAGRLPSSDFEFDFGIKGTAPNMINSFFENIGMAINDLTRPIDAIKHQAKTVTVGTSRISEEIGGLLFDALKHNGFNNSQLSVSNILVLRRLQEVIKEISGTTLYRVSGLNILGEPVAETAVYLEKKEGSAAELISRVETDNRLRGTKHIIVKDGNVFIGKGRTDNRSILIVPVMSVNTNIDHLLLFSVHFEQEVDVLKKIQALGGKYNGIRNKTEEIIRVWDDEYLNLLAIEDLFGLSAEKTSELIADRVQT
ncbi:MAG: SIS domain-containing protein, partial [Deltaproteobacteria bacterium]|nr:SIS domain-containing protein [Deltaproteobacteria bacterium]